MQQRGSCPVQANMQCAAVCGPCTGCSGAEGTAHICMGLADNAGMHRHLGRPRTCRQRLRACVAVLLLVPETTAATATRWLTMVNCQHQELYTQPPTAAHAERGPLRRPQAPLAQHLGSTDPPAPPTHRARSMNQRSHSASSSSASKPSSCSSSSLSSDNSPAAMARRCAVTHLQGAQARRTHNSYC